MKRPSTYGSQSKVLQKSRVVSSQVAEESGTRVARWGDADYSVVLYRSSYASGFRMIVTSLRLDALARTAKAQALRLDERDAPRREIARQKKEADDTRRSTESASREQSRLSTLRDSALGSRRFK